MKPGLITDYTLSGHEGAYLAGRLAAKDRKTGSVGIVVSGEPPSLELAVGCLRPGRRRTRSPNAKIVYAVIGPAAYSDAAGGGA